MSAPIPDPDFSHLRISLATARDARGFTIDKLAEVSGVGRTTILEINRGRYVGKLETWVRLARALDVSLDELTSSIWPDLKQ